jgi:uncharacterized protein YndB with AHSA1/START domain
MSNQRSNEEMGQSLAPETVRLERTLPGPIERVWAFLTEPDRRRRWLAAGDFDLRVGGTITLLFDHASLSHEKQIPEPYREEAGARLSGRVIACEPPRLLTFTWSYEGQESEVAFELVQRGEAVQLILTHRRLRPREILARAAAGWHAHLALLEDVLQERTPRGFWSTHQAREVEYQDGMRQMDDYWRWAAGVQREVLDRGGTWSSRVRRRLEAPIDRVWAAWTDPERLPRWLGKATGDLRVGGTVKLDMSFPQITTARILACEPPRRLRATWQYGDLPVSEVELRLREEAGATEIEIEHFSATSVQDAGGTGAGWETALLHLDRWLADQPPPGTIMHPAADATWTAVSARPARPEEGRA